MLNSTISQVKKVELQGLSASVSSNGRIEAEVQSTRVTELESEIELARIGPSQLAAQSESGRILTELEPDIELAS